METDESYFKKRERELGFKPQNEVAYNQNLPYVDHLDNESSYALTAIKTNLSKAVLSRDLKPGVTYWASQLTRYIRLYGLKFSKEDHVLFIKLFYEIVTIPEVETVIVEQMCNVMIKLLKKRELLTYKDIQLDWFPLYKLVERLTYSKMEPMGLEWIPSSINNKLRSLIRNCRSYFPPETTQDMLDEWRPLLCPFDIVMGKAVKYMDMFLPTLVFNDSGREVSWKLWLNEFLSLWLSVKNGPSWEKYFMQLFARLAHNNIGHIDWTPFVDPLFTRVLRALQLPVGKLQHTTSLASQLPIEYACLWIVSMIGGPGTKHVLKSIKSLLEATETFFHPSNFGKWSTNIFNFLHNLASKLVTRVFRERHKTRCWEPKIPESHLIKDDDIEEFVNILKPVALLTLYSKFGALTATKVLQSLAYLRPDLILPPLLDKTYVALGTLTEPHQVRACLSALSATINPGITGFPEVRKHVLPLLFQCLPALDPNDLPKSTVAFQFISTCMTLIPVVDCSSALQQRSNLNENERELCAMTAQFEDFVLQYLDRCFILLESLNQGHDSHTHESSDYTNKSVTRMEGMSGMIIVTSTSFVLQQSSDAIFKICLDKLFWYATTHLLEGFIAMSTAATLFAVATKAKPSEGFRKFIPHYCQAILDYFADNPDAKKDEKMDKQLAWDLKVLSEMCHIGTEHLLEYKEMLFEVAHHAVAMSAKEGYEVGASILKFCIKGWSMYYTSDRKSVTHDINRSTSEYLAINDWGATMTPWEVDMQWHVPTPVELDSAFDVLDQFLLPALQQLTEFCEGSSDLRKEELHKILRLIKDLLKECYLLLPVDNSDIVSLEKESQTLLKSWPVRTIEMLPYYQDVLSKGDRRHIRGKVYSVVHSTLEKLMQIREDDVESICFIIDIYSLCTLMHEQLKSEFDHHWKVLAAYKMSMKNPLCGNKVRDRFCHIDRTILQQRMRVLAIERSCYTSMHHNVMLDLIMLSTSHYMKVRGNAQALFFHGLGLVPSVAYKKYLPLILRHFDKANNSSHQQFKGALYLLNGKHKSRLFLGFYQKWNVMRQVWPALINAPHSDKPSITKLYDKLALKIQAHFVTVAIESQISDSAVKAASNLMNSKSIPLVGAIDTVAITEEGEQYLLSLNSNNLEMYHSLVDNLVDLYESGQLSWKNSELVLGMLSILLRHDIAIPSRLASLFVSLLVDDAISVRTLSLACVGSIMKQQKRKHAVEMLSVEEIGGQKQMADEICPGDRLDNAWHQYDTGDLPLTKDKFDTMKFIDKTHWGYYTWPKHLKTYAPVDKQPKLDRTRDELSEGEVSVYDKLTDVDFVKKVVEYFCLENEKGKDKFDEKKVDMFRGLFRNFGDTFVPYFKPHIERLVEDKQESHQRCVAEIITGMVMGSKHWNFDKVNDMWSWLVPALRTAVSNISAETLRDWDMAFNHIIQNRDPRRIHWVLDFLTSEPSHPSHSALVEASKLYVLQGGMHQQEWRTPQLLQKMLDHVEPMLGHPYKNIRNRIGSVVASIFLYDVQLLGKPQSAHRTPSTNDFIKRVLSRLDVLMSEETPPLSSSSSESPGSCTEVSPPVEMFEDFDVAMPIPIADGGSLPEMSELPPALIEQIQNGLKKILPPGSPMPDITSLSGIQDQLPTTLLRELALKKASKSDDVRIQVEESVEMPVDNDNSRSETIRVFKTIMKWIVSAQRSTLQPLRSGFLQLLPLVCKMYPVDQQGADEELHRDSRLCLSCMAQSLVPAEHIMEVIETVKNIVTNHSWHARHTVLSYVQVFVFSNLFTVKQNKSASPALQKIILDLLQDEQFEVSRMASVTLSGLIQCGAIALDDELLELAYSMSKTKLKTKKKASASPPQDSGDGQKRVLKRHAGVLMLSACVLSAPYTVPSWMPKVVMHLSDHLHDPQPIQGTIKRTLSDFRRTHHDNWHEDKMKFSSDELAILTDLLVSPSYYA